MHREPITAKPAGRGENADTGIYLLVRAAFLLRGSSLNQWCRDNDVVRQYAEKALRGQRRGPKALALKRRITDAVGLKINADAA